PPKYLVAASLDTSTPCPKERHRYAVAQVLSTNTLAPCFCATPPIAGISCTSKLSQPVDSQHPTLALRRNPLALPAPISVSQHAAMHPRLGPVFPLGHVFREDGRRVIGRRIDCPVLRLRVAAEMGEERILAVVARPIVVSHLSSTFSEWPQGRVRRHYCSRR